MLPQAAVSTWSAGVGQWLVAEVSEIGSGAKERQKREELLKIARRKAIDAILVWRLDRWGRSLVDLVTTLGELGELGVGRRGQQALLQEVINAVEQGGRAPTAPEPNQALNLELVDTFRQWCPELTCEDGEKVEEPIRAVA